MAATAERRLSPRWTAASVIGVLSSEEVSAAGDGVEHLEVLDDRAQRLGGEELQAAHDQDHADQQADEQRAVGRQGAGGGLELRLGGDATPAMASTGIT